MFKWALKEVVTLFASKHFYAERKKSLTMRACERHRVLGGYAALYWRGGSLVIGGN